METSRMGGAQVGNSAREQNLREREGPSKLRDTCDQAAEARPLTLAESLDRQIDTTFNRLVELKKAKEILEQTPGLEDTMKTFAALIGRGWLY